jgi:23S rRNA (cytidine1920-2'-O)/16S rRNA (cytidine1409-2'-O)-methyltransferase
MGARRPRYVNVLEHVRRVRPDVTDPVAAIEGRVLLVGGRVVTNRRSLVRADASVVVLRANRLRGEHKLEAALDRFGVSVADRTCLDLGAAAGGFTRVLIRRGARRVFAVDVGYGQLRGELRSDARVVNLERTNLADVGVVLPSDMVVDVVTMDLSYVALAEAVPQLEPLPFATEADLIGLVKPLFELRLAEPPIDEDELEQAVTHAVQGIEWSRTWRVVATMPSPVRGRNGAREWLIHARRCR